MFKTLTLLTALLFSSVAMAQDTNNLTIKRDATTLSRDTSIYLVVNDRLVSKPLLRGQEVTIAVPANQPVKLAYAAYVQHNLGTRHTKDTSSPDIIPGTVITPNGDTVVTITPTQNGFRFE